MTENMIGWRGGPPVGFGEAGHRWAYVVHPDFWSRISADSEVATIQNIDLREGKVMREFVGKAAFVTGGASGIGLALGRALAEAGCKVMLADIEEAALDAAVASLSCSGRKYGELCAMSPILLP